MAIRVVEQAVCDRCGCTKEYEKFDSNSMTIRIEGFGDWLRRLGWVIIQYENSSFRAMHYCSDLCAKAAKGEE
jgi:hypothetical protein